MYAFSAKINKIGINPYVHIPAATLKALFVDAGKNKGAIPIKLVLNKQTFIQNLVKYSGKWRLYLNTPMRKALGKDVGDVILVKIAYDPEVRKIPMHPKLQKALEQNKEAKAVFDKLAPSRQKEIVRYIGFLKSEEAVDKNVQKAVMYLLGKDRFAGRDL